MIWLQLFVLCFCIDLIANEISNPSECNQPLGLEDGRIPDDKIQCTSTTAGVAPECASVCSDIRYNSYYWCSTFFSNSLGIYFVQFQQHKYVSGFSVRSLPGLTIGKLLLSYDLEDETGVVISGMIYGASQDVIGKVFDIAEGEIMVWLENPILAKKIGFIPYGDNPNNSASNFEVFGCPYWDKTDIYPVGMESGLIQDSQIYSYNKDGDYRGYNKYSARLNSAFPGWKASEHELWTSTGSRTTFLQITFENTQKLLSISVQQFYVSSAYSGHYFIHYGLDLSSMKSYSGTGVGDASINSAMLLPTVKVNDDYRRSNYMFNYPLISKYVRYHTHDYRHPYVKIEFYASSFTSPSHSWPLRSGNMEDEKSHNSFQPVDGITFDSNGIIVNGSMSDHFRTPSLNGNCFLNPAKCVSGMTVAFTAKVFEKPKGSLVSSVPTARSMSASTCMTNGLDFKEHVSLYFPSIPLQKGITVLKATTFNMDGVLGTEGTKVKMHMKVFVGVEENFVTDCVYSSSAKANASGYITLSFSTGGYQFESVDNVLRNAFDHPLWIYGQSLAVVFSPVTGESVTLPEDVQLNVYVNYACYDYQHEFLQTLDDGQFNQSNTACSESNKSPASIKFNKDFMWANCGGPSNYMDIMLPIYQYITMFKVESTTFGLAHTFYVRYMIKNDWLIIEDMNGIEFLFEKKSTGVQYLPLPAPIFARALRIIPVSYNGSLFHLNFDIVICKTYDDSPDVVGSSIDEIRIEHDSMFWYSLYQIKSTYWCNCVFGGTSRCYSGDEGLYPHGNGNYYCTCQQCRNDYTHIYKHHPSLASTSVTSTLYSGYRPYLVNLEIDSSNNIYGLDESTLSIRNVTSGAATVYPNDCIDYLLLEESVICLQADLMVYHKELLGVPQQLTDCCVKNITYNYRTASLYGLRNTDGIVMKHDNSGGGLGEWKIVSSELTCSILRISQDGTLWCLNPNGYVYEWYSLYEKWQLISPLSNCKNFDVGATYVLCVRHQRDVIRYERNSKRNEPLQLVAPLPTTKFKVNTKLEILFAIEGGVIRTSAIEPQPGNEWSTRYNFGINSYTECVEYYDFGVGHNNNIRCACVTATMVTLMGDTDIHRQGPNVFYFNFPEPIIPKYFQVILSSNLYYPAAIVMIASTKDIVYIDCNQYYRSCSVSETLARGVDDVAEFVYKDNVLFVLKSDGNIYKQTNVDEISVYRWGTCKSFKIAANDRFYCLNADGFIYYYNYWSWYLLIDEVVCDTFDVLDNIAFCSVAGNETWIFKKRLPAGVDYVSEQPTISSGLQRYYGNSFGAGFQISFIPQISLFYVMLHDTINNRYVHGYFYGTNVYEWNQYAFVWNKENNRLRLYSNSEIVSTNDGASGSGSGNLPWLNFINIGSFYDHLPSSRQQIGIRDLKLWENSFTEAEMKELNEPTLELFAAPGLLKVFRSKRCKTFLAHGEFYYCLNEVLGRIYMHPRLEIMNEEKKWSTHSTNENCTELHSVGEYLFCKDQDNSWIIWLSDQWRLVNDNHYHNVCLSYDPLYFLALGRDKTVYKIQIKGCIENLLVGSTCDHSVLHYNFDQILYANGYTYFRQGIKFYRQHLTIGFTYIDSLDTECRQDSLYVYDGSVFCKNNQDFPLKRDDNYEVAFDRPCSSHFEELQDYFLCYDDNAVYVKWKSFIPDHVSFSKKIKDFVTFGTSTQKSCHRIPSLSGPCHDAETFPKGENNKYYYGFDEANYETAEHNCEAIGGQIARIDTEEEESLAIANGFYRDAYIEYHYALGKNDDPSRPCPYLRRDKTTMKVSYTKCDPIIYYLCMVPNDGLYHRSKTSFPAISMLHLDVDGACTKTTEVNQLAYFVYEVDISGLDIDTVVTYASLSMIFTTTPLSTQVYIGLADVNYTDCDNWPANFILQNALSYNFAKKWIISDVGGVTNSPDISEHVNYFNHKLRTRKVTSDIMPIIVFWNENIDGNATTSIGEVTNVQLEVVHSVKDDNYFVLFPTNLLKPHYPPGVLLTPAYDEMFRSFTFSYYMYGADIGTLYLWFIDSADVEKPHPAFYAHGDQGNQWRVATVQTPTGGVSWKLLFLAYRTSGSHGDIAIDNIDSSAYAYYSTSEIQYTMNSESGYLTTLEEFQLPQPILLFPFKNSFLGIGIVNTTLVGGDELASTWFDDKYGFPRHALKVSTELTVNDIGNSVDGNHFTIAFNIKFNYTDAVICHFDDVLKIALNGDSLKIEGKETQYQSSWKFPENSWTYITVVINNNKMLVYYNNTLDNETIYTKDGEFSPFPTSLKLFSGGSYNGLISCFQFYNRSLTSLEAAAVEFCPDRIEKTTCPVSCKNGGVCVPMTKDCQCPKTVTRFYNEPDCESVFQERFFQQATFFETFDVRPTYMSNNKTYLHPSPINHAYCINSAHATGYINADYPSTTKAFLTTFWLYVYQNESIGYQEILKIANLVFSANFTIVPSDSSVIIANLRASYESTLCESTFLLPVRAWAFYTVVVDETELKWSINDGEMYISPCKNIESNVTMESNVSSESNVRPMKDFMFGGPSEMCIDEFSFFVLDDGLVMQDIMKIAEQYYLYVSADERRTHMYNGKVEKSVQYYPSALLQCKILNLPWIDELLDIESYEYSIVKKNIEEAVDYGLNKHEVLRYYIRSNNVLKIALEDTHVTAHVSAVLENHNKLSSAALYELANNSFSYEYKNYQFVINWLEKGEGIPLAPLECVLSLLNESTIKIKIMNVDKLNTRYHKGYYIESQAYYVNTDIPFLEKTTRVFYHGNDEIIYYDVVPFRDYYMNIYSITHQGYSMVFKSNISTVPSVNVVKPTIQYTGPANTTSILMTWLVYEYKNWNSKNLISYDVFYKPLNYDDHNYDIETYTHAVISPDKTSYQLTNLEPYREYSIYLGTTNDIGLGRMDHVIKRSGEGVPELAPVVRNITTTSSVVFISYDAIPNDIEVFNAPFFNGYNFQFEAFYPELVEDRCKSFSQSTSNAVLNVEYEFWCTPMQVYRLLISAVTTSGIGIENEYCFVLGRTVPGQITILNVTIGPTLANDGASVMITVGNISLTEENTVVTHYNISLKILDFEDEQWRQVTLPINHTENELNYWSRLEGYNESCYAFPAPLASSKVVSDILPVAYFSNYTIVAKACSEEGCSPFFLEVKFRTAEHTPICPPKNIKLYNISSTELTVDFDPITRYCLSGVLKYYLLILIETERFLYWVNTLGLSLETIRNNTIEYGLVNKTNVNRFTFRNLNEYWNYTLLVSAENGAGLGVISEPIDAFTEEDIPHGAPQNCVIDHNNSSSFTINITEPEVLLQNGLLYYEINIINVFYEALDFSISYDGEITSLVVKNLSKYTYHNVTVYPTTKYGRGPSCFLRVRTLEDVPSLPPQTLTIQSIKNDTVVLTWLDIPERSVHGQLEFYLLTGYGYLRNGSLHHFHEKVNAYNFTFTIFPATWYHFNISGCTGVGCGEIAFIRDLSLEMVPSGIVQNVNVSDVLPNSFNVTWDTVLPMEQRGNITHYTVAVQSVPNSWEEPNYVAFDFTFIRDVPYVFLEGLNNYTDYNLRITAFTLIGAGPQTDDTFRTAENVPSAAPLNVSGIDTSSSSLNMTWLAVDISQHEGVLLGHNISFKALENCTVENAHRCRKQKGYLDCPGGTNTTCLITGLSLDMPYEIQIAAYTNAGNGPWSDPVNVTTGYYVDGNWTAWSNWGSCSRSCGLGREMRQRWCVNPEPERGGKECPPEEKYDYRECNDFVCPGYYLGDSLESCTNTCKKVTGVDFICSPRHNYQNTSTAFLSTLAVDNHTIMITTDCQTNKDEIFYELPSDPSYVVDSNVCRGFMNIPFLTNCDAVGPNSIKRLCRCQTLEDSLYDEWASWGLCSKECGSGSYTRYRNCISDDPLKCTAKEVDTQDCNTDPCPLDGQWGTWTEFSNCTLNCGPDAVQIRTRKCDSPKPLYNGLYCPGISEDVAFDNCNHFPCPVHGKWGEWQELFECSHSCGNESRRSQYRECNNPEPMYGGNDCVGDRQRTFPCNQNQPCKPSKYIFTVRFTDWKWESYEMYKFDHPKTKNFTTTITHEIREFYKKSDRASSTLDISINFVKVWKGSIFSIFEIDYPEVPSSEALLIQHDLEGGTFEGTSVELHDITTPNLPDLPPLDVTAISLTPFTINVTWDPVNDTSKLNGEFYLYQVYYRKLHVSENETVWENFGTKNLSMTLKRLVPGEWYGVRVLASNEQGNGIASKLVKVQVIEGIPYIKPPSCFMKIMDEKTVFFSWDLIPTIQVPGTLRGYRIRFRKYFEETWTEVIVESTMNLRTIGLFQPFTWYWVEIAGFTNAGVGPHDLFVFQTPPGPPNVAPPNATIHERYSTTELLVTWDEIPKASKNGQLKGYQLFYRKIKQGGVEKKTVDFNNCTVDEFTFSCKLTGLESYTQYEVSLYGYNDYGLGPSVVMYGDTCKCPKYIFSNWYENNPYTKAQSSLHTGTKAVGLFPDILKMVVEAVCTDCVTYTPRIFYNLTRNGRASMKSDERDVKKLLDGGVDLSFPIYGKFDLTRYAGYYPFIGFVNSQGSAMVIYQPRIKVIGLTGILNAVFTAWPVILLAVLMAVVAGWVLWFFEQPACGLEQIENETDITRTRSIYGAYEGFWLSFISMTTLGYGDLCPSSNSAKVFMVLWILIGLNIVCIFGGAVSSSMSVGGMDKEYKLYGTKVAAVKNTFEESIAIRRNGIVGKNGTNNHTTVLDVLNAVANREVEIALVDATSLQPYVDDLENSSLSVYKILDFEAGFGAVLSGEFSRIETDMRSFVSSNQAEISKFVEENVGPLIPNVVEIEEQLFSAEESESMLLLLVIVYLVLAVVGIAAWQIRMIYTKNQQKKQIAPINPLLGMHQELSSFSDLVSKLSNGIDELSEGLNEKHRNERYDLYLIKTSYDRLLRRAGKENEFQKEGKINDDHGRKTRTLRR